MGTYSDLLRDPRWQRKRLEIMERDLFRCRRCERGDRTLNVHHTYYESGLKPWEYDEATLFTFCDPCHKDEEEKKAYWDRRLAYLLRTIGATNGTMERLVLIIEDLKKEYGYGRLSLIEHLLSQESDNFKGHLFTRGMVAGNDGKSRPPYKDLR